MSALQNEEIAKDLVNSIAERLCNSEFHVNVSQDKKTVVVKVLVKNSDMGVMIGPEGSIAKGINAMLRILGKRHEVNYRYKVEKIK